MFEEKYRFAKEKTNHTTLEGAKKPDAKKSVSVFLSRRFARNDERKDRLPMRNAPREPATCGLFRKFAPSH